MLIRFIGPLRRYALQKASVTASSPMVVRNTARSFVTTAHHTLTILGIVAIAALGTLFVKPDFADHIKSFSPFAVAPVQPVIAAASAPVNLMDTPSPSFAKPQAAAENDNNRVAEHSSITIEEKRFVGNQREQQWVTTWLAKRYRVASDATNMLVSAAYLAARETKLDPLLILSVMAIESGFNPFAESPVGAQGLMQVMSKIHHDKFQHLGGVKAALNPVANIKVGALILKDYVTRGGSVEAGLKTYVGAAAFENDAGYGSKVLAEYRRLKEVASGKNVPVFSTPVAAPKPRPAEPAADKTPAPLEAELNSPAAPSATLADPKQVAAL